MKRHEGEIEPITENECTGEQALVDIRIHFILQVLTKLVEVIELN